MRWPLDRSPHASNVCALHQTSSKTDPVGVSRNWWADVLSSQVFQAHKPYHIGSVGHRGSLSVPEDCLMDLSHWGTLVNELRLSGTMFISEAVTAASVWCLTGVRLSSTWKGGWTACLMLTINIWLTLSWVFWVFTTPVFISELQRNVPSLREQGEKSYKPTQACWAPPRRQSLHAGEGPLPHPLFLPPRGCRKLPVPEQMQRSSPSRQYCLGLQVLVQPTVLPEMPFS